MTQWLEWLAAWRPGRSPKRATEDWEVLSLSWLEAAEAGRDETPGGIANRDFFVIDRLLAREHRQWFWDRWEIMMSDRIRIDDIPNLEVTEALDWISSLEENGASFVIAITRHDDQDQVSVTLSSQGLVMGARGVDLEQSINFVYRQWLMTSDGWNVRKGTSLPTWHKAVDSK